jgi:hypothetical protein
MNLLPVGLADFLDPNPTADPVTWTQDKRGGFLWSKQREIAKSVQEHRFTAVKSCHGTGKSWLAADIVAWWLDEHPIGEAFAVTTAPTAPQVEAILWREISVAHDDAKLKGRITWGQVPMWKVGDRMIAYGRKPADYADPNKAMQAFQGIHARYVLVVLDEACGIPKWLWNAVDSLVTNDNSRVLAIGNPDDPSSEFYNVCRPGSDYNVIQVSAFDLPWSTGEEVPAYLEEQLTGEKWVEERKRKWGEGSPLYQAKVLGEFPDLSDDSLISPRQIREAQERTIEPDFDAELFRETFGGDVARYGVDKTTVYKTLGDDNGIVIRKVDEWHKQNTMRTAGHFARILNGEPGIPMWIDISGLGSGTYDRLREQSHSVMPFDGGERAMDPVRFKNRRAEQYWYLRSMFEKGAVDLDPLDEDLASQLQSMKWKVNSRGQIIIESKEDMKKRGLPSPDCADAAMMSARQSTWVPEPEEVGAGQSDLTSDLLGRPM